MAYFIQNLKRTGVDLSKHLDILVKTAKQVEVTNSHIDVLIALVSTAWFQEQIDKEKYDNCITLLQAKRNVEDYTPKAVKYNLHNVERNDLIIERLVI
jgi:hypothetical protein